MNSSPSKVNPVNRIDSEEEINEEYDHETVIRQLYTKLKSINKPSLIIKNIRLLLAMSLMRSRCNIDSVNISFEYNFCRILSGLLKESGKQFKKYYSQNKLKKTLNNDDDDIKLDTIYSTCNIFVGIVITYSNLSEKFIREAHKHDVIKHLFWLLKKGKLVETASESEADTDALDLVVYVCMALGNLSRLSSNFIEIWKTENAVERILDVAKRLSHNEDCKLASYVTLASIVDENELKRLNGWHAALIIFLLL